MDATADPHRPENRHFLVQKRNGPHAPWRTLVRAARPEFAARHLQDRRTHARDRGAVTGEYRVVDERTGEVLPW